MNYADINRANLRAATAQAMQSHPSFDVGPGRWFGVQGYANEPPPIPVNQGTQQAPGLSRYAQMLASPGGLGSILRHFQMNRY